MSGRPSITDQQMLNTTPAERVDWVGRLVGLVQSTLLRKNMILPKMSRRFMMFQKKVRHVFQIVKQKSPCQGGAGVFVFGGGHFRTGSHHTHLPKCPVSYTSF